MSHREEACKHCGTPFHPTPGESEFCCQGCRYVHGLITGQGLDRFYDLKDRRVSPVGNTVFDPVDTDWLLRLVRAEEERAAGEDRPPQCLLEIQGISCVGCSWLIERLFEECPGALGIRVYPTRGSLHLRWQTGAFDAAAFARQLRRFGYRLGPPGEHPDDPALHDLTRRIGLSAAFALNAMLFTLPRYLGLSADTWLTPLLEAVTLLCASLSLLVGGSYFIRRSVASLRLRTIHIDLPISLGLILAYLGSLAAWFTGLHDMAYFDFVSIFTFLMLGGRWVQERSVLRNRNRLLKGRHAPEPVLSGTDPATPLPLENLASGRRFRLRPGAILPVTSRLCGDGAEFSLHWINGEPDPRLFTTGQSVRSGALLLGDAIAEFEAEEAWPHSLLHRLLEEHDPAPTAPLLRDRIIRLYLVVILVIAATGFAAWLAATGDLPRSLQVLISVLVVSCPCAIGVALPLADDLAAQTARKIGVFVREGAFWSRAGRVRHIIYDKTGTLSLDTLRLVNPDALATLTPEALRAAATLVQHSRHPVAACLRATLFSRRIDPFPGFPVHEIPGHGLEARLPDGVWKLGRPAWACGDDQARGTALARDGRLVASFLTEEHIRPDATGECRLLLDRGFSIHILSGDHPERVRAVALDLGLPPSQALGNMEPHAKAEWVAALDRRDTLMIGDGANDSLAFDRAWCRGTPAINTGLLEYKADFYFLGASLRGVRRLLEISAVRARAVRAVLLFTIAYNLIALTLCLAGLMNPLLAAILMPASSVLSLSIIAARRWQ